MNFKVQVGFELLLSRETCPVHRWRCHEIGHLWLDWWCECRKKREMILKTVAGNSTHTVCFYPNNNNETLQQSIWALRKYLYFLFSSIMIQGDSKTARWEVRGICIKHISNTTCSSWPIQLFLAQFAWVNIFSYIPKCYI